MKKTITIALVLLIMPFTYSFRAFMDEHDWITWGNRVLTETFDPSTEAKIKKWEIMLTPDHFIRVRKTYQQGKQAYYSFNLKRFAAMNYVAGSALTDTLQMQTQADDIIVQTYDDPKGDIDSMATVIAIPVKKMAPERLDSLKQALQFLKQKGL